jgi:glycerophosphoryl diester phosphodiesterase
VADWRPARGFRGAWLLAAALAIPGLADVGDLRVIGHRGAAGHAPENTLAGVAAALELGVDEVELDVQRSRDGVLVLFHDATLDAKTDLSGRVDEYDAATLVRADIGRWFDREHPQVAARFSGTGLNTLEDVFQRFGGRLVYHLEIKSEAPQVPGLLLEALGSFGLSERAVITSFHLAQLRAVRELDAEVPLCLLVRRGGGPGGLLAAFERADAEGFQMVGVAASDLTREMVRAAHGRGLEIRAWGVRDDADIERVLEVGADGLTVDWPERVPRPASGEAQAPR